MKRLILFTVALATLTVAAPAAAAPSPLVANGGGTGSWTPAGEPPASQFGLAVSFLGAGVAAGHFNCLMAGRSVFPGFQFMAVRGTVTAGTATPTSASFSGAGTLLYHFDGSGPTQKASVQFFVNISEGGPGVGTLQLTVVGVPFVPGGVAAFPPEWVSSGQIKIH